MLIFKEEVLRYKKQYEDILTERNKFKQQCTQVQSVLNMVSNYFYLEEQV